MKDLAVVILAGGKGERFWPYSRADRPKQFLKIVGDKTLLQRTFERAMRLTGPDNIYIVTGQAFCHLVREQIPAVPNVNIIVEPVGRDTAPAIGLAATFIAHRKPDQLMMVLPSDHLIQNEEAFVESVYLACSVAEHTGALVTFGIVPARPDPGFGYIKKGEPLGAGSDGKAYRVSAFTEKPSSELAVRFFESQSYLWNSGMFIWAVDVILGAVARHLPGIATGLKGIASALGTAELQSVMSHEFPRMPAISIDYGVLEKEDNCVVVPADFGWDDLGTWLSLDRVEQQRSGGNIIRAQTTALLDCAGSTIVSGDRPKLIAALGINSLLVVDTPDALLVADKARAQDLKSLVTLLKEEHLTRYLESTVSAHLLEEQAATTVDPESVSFLPQGPRHAKPWGWEVWWAVTPRYSAKVLFVRAGQQLSKQYHRQKQETMLCLKGNGTLELGDGIYSMTPGVVFEIRPRTVHRLAAESDLYVLEVSTSELDDVVRLEDAYGRTTS